MAKLDGYNPNNHDPSKPIEAMPKGDYLVMMVDSEWKDTKANDGGKYLMFTAEVIDGEYKGRKLFVNLNLINKNPVAVKIAEEDLSAICHAVGEMGVLNDSATLHGKPLVAKVGVKEYKGELRNEVKGFRAMKGAAPVAAPVAAAPAAAPASAAPWA